MTHICKYIILNFRFRDFRRPPIYLGGSFFIKVFYKYRLYNHINVVYDNIYTFGKLKEETPRPPLASTPQRGEFL
jgi:hypothetical protein